VFKSAGETEPIQKVPAQSSELAAGKNSKVQIAIALLCFVLFCLAYKCVVSKSFLGDDHVHLIWLRKAVLDPSLVLHNFYSNWLYASTTPQCYRPMISVFMFTDYLLWHHNAIGFHITNFIFHLLGCAALFGCVYEVSRWSPRVGRLTLWPVLAAGTFALYPSHPEAVSWVTGRVDAIVTTFYLASVYSFMLWRRTGRRLVFVASLVFMLLSLASKEMAVTIPFVWFFFELLKPKRDVRDHASGEPLSQNSANGSAPSPSISPSSIPLSLPARLKNATVYSLPAWGLLVAYFGLRKLALGTFIGGYDDSLAIDKALLIQQWTSGLHMLFVPLNAYYASDNAWLTPVWIILTGTIYVVSIFALSKKAYRDQLLFFLAFAVVSFAPVYKLFNGLPDLEGSRFSYLGSAPIAACFAFGLAYLPVLFVRRQKTTEVDHPQEFKSIKLFQAAICLAYFCTATLMLWLNNQPWSVAGRWVSSLEKSFNVILANPPAGTKFAFFNIPNNYRGAYLARNAISDIGQHQDADWKAVEPDDKHSETGQTRQSIVDGGNNYQTYYWSDDLGKFVPVRLSRALNKQDVSDWNTLPLSKKCSIIQGSERIADLKNNSGWTISAGSTPVMLVVNFQKLQPSSIEFLEVDSSSGIQNQPSHEPELSLLLSNTFLSTTPIAATVAPESPSMPAASGSQRNILFSLRSLPGWFSTNDKSSMVLLIPPEWSGSFNLSIKGDDNILPRFRRMVKAADVSAHSGQKLFYDVSKIPTAIGASLQISKKNECFKRQCTFDFDDEHSGKVIQLSGVKSNVELKYDDLNGDGQYQIRCWALNAAGARIGVGSDYLFVTAQKEGP
jgi:hypothetical protein